MTDMTDPIPATRAIDPVLLAVGVLAVATVVVPAAVVFVLTSVQAYSGGGRTLWVHVLGVAWLAVRTPGAAR